MTDWAVDCLASHIEGTEHPITAEGFEGGLVKLTKLREVAGEPSSPLVYSLRTNSHAVTLFLILAWHTSPRPRASRLFPGACQPQSRSKWKQT